MPVAIVTDTCHYMPRTLVDSNAIHEVSLYVHWAEDTERESAISDYGAFYDRLRTAKALPTTSQPSIGDFLAVYEPLLERGEDIVSIHLAGGMSGTVRAAAPYDPLPKDYNHESLDAHFHMSYLAGAR